MNNKPAPIDDPVPPGYLRSKSGDLYPKPGREPNAEDWKNRMDTSADISYLQRTKRLPPILAAAMESARTEPFQRRGLSHRTIQALIDHGVDLPERLLFMKNAELNAIRGIGKASLAEIAAYQARFTGDNGKASPSE
jgi:hypothetical protein